jgi:hypothetical protein
MEESECRVNLKLEFIWRSASDVSRHGRVNLKLKFIWRSASDVSSQRLESGCKIMLRLEFVP